MPHERKTTHALAEREADGSQAASQPILLTDKQLARLGLGQDLLNLPQAAARLGLGLSIVKMLVRRGDLASLKIASRRLVPVTAIEDFIAAQQSAGQETDEAPGSACTPGPGARQRRKRAGDARSA